MVSDICCFDGTWIASENVFSNHEWKHSANILDFTKQEFFEIPGLFDPANSAPLSLRSADGRVFVATDSTVSEYKSVGELLKHTKANEVLLEKGTFYTSNGVLSLVGKDSWILPRWSSLGLGGVEYLKAAYHLEGDGQLSRLVDFAFEHHPSCESWSLGGVEVPAPALIACFSTSKGSVVSLFDSGANGTIHEKRFPEVFGGRVSVIISPTGDTAAYLSDTSFTLIKVPEGALIHQYDISSHGSTPSEDRPFLSSRRRLDYSVDGTMVAVALEDAVWIVNVRTSEIEATKALKCTAVSFSENGEILAVGASSPFRVDTYRVPTIE